MKVKIKKMWLKALRSGEYKQCRESMCVGRGSTRAYCCLGVLEQLYADATGTKFQDTGFLSEGAAKWAGLESDDPYLTYRQRYQKGMNAATLNDSGKSFEFIADRIEKYL